MDRLDNSKVTVLLITCHEAEPFLIHWLVGVSLDPIVEDILPEPVVILQVGVPAGVSKSWIPIVVCAWSVKQVVKLINIIFSGICQTHL